MYRRHRATPVGAGEFEQTRQRLGAVMANADFVAPTAALRERAIRLLAAHPLRAGDALQLAAALAWCDDTPAGETFVCLDGRLRDAARAEGFDLLPA
jgi:hypothetical protein